MTDFNNPERSIEDQLGDYGDVLRAHLDGAAETVTKPSGMFLVGAPAAAAASPKRSMNRPVVAIVSIAAAVLLFVGVLVPGLTNDPNNSITTTGPDVANQPEDLDGVDNGGSDAIADKKASGEDAADAEAKEEDEVDWSGFTVGIAKDKAVDDVDAAVASEGSDDKTVEKDTAAGALGDDEDKPDEDKPDEEKTEEEKADEEKPDEAKVEAEGDKETAAEDKADDGKADDGKAADDGEGKTECPSDAVVLAGECYLVVPPSCGDLEVNPVGDGCLKLIGAASAAGGCPGAYTLEGDTCVKQLTASVACAEGVTADGSCLIKEEATGGTAGCADGQLNIGGTCYALSAPSASGCGDLETLPSGECRYPVSGESASACPAGFEPWDNICYRYEDGPTYECAVGESDGGGWCKSTESGTPGPDVCDDGVLQDAAGCYILVGTQEDGSCGELEELDGQCRKNKSSYPTWTCADGKTVYEDACYVYTEAVATCAAGEPVDGGAKCKSIVDATATSGCPDYALEDAQGCYKAKQATTNCGDLHVAPDGVNCKEWVGAATGSGGECSAGFDLVGSYCKKYVDGTPSCSGSDLVYDAGKPLCRYTQPAGSSSAGCGAGEVEKAGQCYLVVPASCQDLDVDVFGNGCKKPITDT